jgi:hypothetical protein
MRIRQIGVLPFLCLVLIAAIPQLTTPCSGQAQSKYQTGTIMAVRPHQQDANKTDSATQYDVDVRVGNTLYTVLYTPPPGTYGAQFSAGLQMMVLVGANTITFNDILGHSREVPILNRKTVPTNGGQ